MSSLFSASGVARQDQISTATTSTADPATQAQAKIAAARAVISSTAHWRREMSKKYVRDEVRNARAADLLLLLASEEPALPDSLVAQIADCPGLLSAVREVGRQVGFSLFPVTLAQFLDASLRAAKSNEGRPR